MKKFKYADWAAVFFFACLMTLCMIPVQYVSALSAGIYTGSVTSSYYNPDTGAVDDGGTSNAALGDGMCRSATGTTALVECDGKNTWVTIRLLLQSNCSNVSFYTRSGYDSYSKVSYEVMQEDSANDSIDYRFKVADAGVKIKGSMYVAPMGRNVTWYLYINTGSLKSGSGDFVTSIDLKSVSSNDSSGNTAASSGSADKNSASSVASASNGTQSSGSSTAANKVSDSNADNMNNTNNKNEKNDDSSADKNDAVDEKDKKNVENEKATVKEGSDSSDTDADEGKDVSDNDSVKTGADDDTDGENNDSVLAGGACAGFVALFIIIAAVCGLIFFFKRKKQ